MDIEKLIERLKHDYHGYSTVENNPEETFHDMVECLTALSTLQPSNEPLTPCDLCLYDPAGTGRGRDRPSETL